MTSAISSEFESRISFSRQSRDARYDVNAPPTISVAVPVYRPNLEYLDALMASLTRQALRPAEVVIADDSPGAWDLQSVMRNAAASLPVRYLANEVRLGMAANWNRAVRQTSSAFVLLLHRDDVLMPDALSTLADALSSDDRILCVGSGVAFIGERGESLTRPLRVNDRSHIFQTAGLHRIGRAELTYLSLRNGQVIGEPSAVMFRRAAFDRAGGYDATYRHAADVEFVLRVALHGDVGYVNANLVRRRWHGQNTTHANRRKGVVATDRRRLYRRYAGLLSARERDRARAAMLTYAALDAFRGLLRIDLRQAVLPLLVGDMWRVTPRAVGERLLEIRSGVNLDIR